jgi:hypothetical protein
MGAWMYRTTYTWPRHQLVSGQLHAPGALPPEKPRDTPWIGGSPESVWTTWRGQNLPLQGLELWSLGCPARSQSLYRLSNPDKVTQFGFHDGDWKALLWVVRACSMVEVYRRFGGLPPLLDRGVSQVTKKQRAYSGLAVEDDLVGFLGLLFRPWGLRQYVPPKHRWFYRTTRLHVAEWLEVYDRCCTVWSIILVMIRSLRSVLHSLKHNSRND